MAEMTMYLLKFGLKKHCMFILGLLLCLGEANLWPEDPQVALWRSPCGRELKATNTCTNLPSLCEPPVGS